MRIFQNMLGSLQETTISSLKFFLDASHFIEKLFWFAMWIGGSIFMVYIVQDQIVSWQSNPIMTHTLTSKLTDLDFPALTFCPLFSNPLGPKERLLSGIVDGKTPVSGYSEYFRRTRMVIADSPVIVKIRGTTVKNELC